MTSIEDRPSLAPSEDPYVLRVRREISDLDRSLVELVNKRLRLVAQLKHYKEEHGIGFVDLAREQWMLQYLQRANRGPLSEAGLAELYHELLDKGPRLARRKLLPHRASVEIGAGCAASYAARGDSSRNVSATSSSPSSRH